MYYIIVYDCGIDRVNVLRTFLRQYLNWVQNSVFEGELTKAQYMEVVKRIKEIVDDTADSILIYEVHDKKWLRNELIGIEKAKKDNII